MIKEKIFLNDANFPTIAFIILNYLNFHDTIECAENIQNALNGYVDYQIIIVDNDSKNESDVLLKSFANTEENFFYIQTNKNGGFAFGNNIGIKKAISMGIEYAVIVNPDIEGISANKIKEMIKNMINLEATIIVPRLEGYNDIHKRVKKPSALLLFLEPMIHIYKLLNKLILKKSFDSKYENDSKPIKIYKPYAQAMMIKTNRIKDIGFMDEKTFLFAEEVILAERLLKKNDDSIYLLPWVSVRHRQSTSIDLVMSSLKRQKQKEISNKYYYREYRKFGGLFTLILLFNMRIIYLIKKITSNILKAINRKSR